MGIRVSCPNGHVLNVKSHLAGKKGKCPTCGAAFEIPSSAAEAEQDADAPRTAFDQIDIEQLTRESAQAVTQPANRPQSAPRTRTSAGRGPAMGGEGSVSVAVIDEPAKPGGNSGGGPPAEITSDPTSVWYVRRASGEQYGPAQGLMFWQWVQEGRVPEDSHVWKQGWPEWKSAREWLARKDSVPQRAAQPGFAGAPQSAARPSASPSPTTPAARSTILHLPDRASPQPLPSSLSPVGATATRNARKRKNADVTAAIIIVLLLMLFVSLTGAIVVVYQSMG